ncbi:hypothetical protein J7E70_07795 [Variovorax paradoxus]|nr:hypothetical protein [Variovorax paradoxus]MBT2300365.1 hypothetical protein [Variovorax paradoxus]
MALASYSDLLASVASWMNRTDLTAVIPDFVTIAESRIARDLRLRKQLVSGTMTTSTTTRAVALPTGWLEFTSVNIDGTPSTVCQAVTTEHLDTKYPEDGFSGHPFVYAIEGDYALFGPTPDDTYTVNVDYYARFAALSTGTNWLFTNHPTIYLYACMREGSLFTMNKQGAAEWDALYRSEVADLQKHDDMATHSGSALRVKAV